MPQGENNQAVPPCTERSESITYRSEDDSPDARSSSSNNNNKNRSISNGHDCAITPPKLSNGASAATATKDEFEGNSVKSYPPYRHSSKKPPGCGSSAAYYSRQQNQKQHYGPTARNTDSNSVGNVLCKGTKSEQSSASSYSGALDVASYKSPEAGDLSNMVAPFKSSKGKRSRPTLEGEKYDDYKERTPSMHSSTYHKAKKQQREQGTVITSDSTAAAASVKPSATSRTDGMNTSLDRNEDLAAGGSSEEDSEPSEAVQNQSKKLVREFMASQANFLPATTATLTSATSDVSGGSSEGGKTMPLGTASKRKVVGGGARSTANATTKQSLGISSTSSKTPPAPALVAPGLKVVMNEARRERKREINRLSAQRKRERERLLLDTLSRKHEELSKINSILKADIEKVQAIMESARGICQVNTKLGSDSSTVSGTTATTYQHTRRPELKPSSSSFSDQASYRQTSHSCSNSSNAFTAVQHTPSHGSSRSSNGTNVINTNIPSKHGAPAHFTYPSPSISRQQSQSYAASNQDLMRNLVTAFGTMNSSSVSPALLMSFLNAVCNNNSNFNPLGGAFQNGGNSGNIPDQSMLNSVLVEILGMLLNPMSNQSANVGNTNNNMTMALLQPILTMLGSQAQSQPPQQQPFGQQQQQESSVTSNAVYATTNNQMDGTREISRTQSQASNNFNFNNTLQNNVHGAKPEVQNLNKLFRGYFVNSDTGTSDSMHSDAHSRYIGANKSNRTKSESVVNMDSCPSRSSSSVNGGGRSVSEFYDQRSASNMSAPSTMPQHFTNHQAPPAYDGTNRSTDPDHAAGNLLALARQFGSGHDNRHEPLRQQSVASHSNFGMIDREDSSSRDAANLTKFDERHKSNVASSFNSTNMAHSSNVQPRNYMPKPAPTTAATAPAQTQPIGFHSRSDIGNAINRQLQQDKQQNQTISAILQQLSGLSGQDKSSLIELDASQMQAAMALLGSMGNKK